MVDCLHRSTFDASELLARHPPELRHRYKRLVFEQAMRGPPPDGRIVVTRWRASAAVTALSPTGATRVEPMSGHFDYAGDDRAVWHVNFADPHLFFGYGSALLAQDELQAAEHPLLGSVREAMDRVGQALTEQDGQPTPVLVRGVERRCEIRGLYGNQFAAAPEATVRAAIAMIAPPSRSNLIAIAAPSGGIGRYQRRDVDHAVTAAYVGFAAAVAESQRAWPGTPTEVRSGFWGCGAFGGNRVVMTAVQLLAARLANVAHLRFYVFDDRGLDNFRAGAAALDDAMMGASTVDAILDRLIARGFEWGVSDGN